MGAWNIIRTATTDDQTRLDAAAERFMSRHNVDVNGSGSASYNLELCLSDLEDTRLVGLWRQVVKRALCDPHAEGIAYGQVGYNA